MMSADDLKYPEIKKIELGVVSFNSLKEYPTFKTWNTVLNNNVPLHLIILNFARYSSQLDIDP